MKYMMLMREVSSEVLPDKQKQIRLFIKLAAALAE
jgi:hypothetical protein